MTVLGNAKFQRIIQQVRNLVECDAVQLFLGCTEPTLRHPLLAACSITDYCAVGSTLEIEHTDLLHNERIRALCDMAMQTGKMQSLDDGCFHTEETQITQIQSIAVMPLERRPAGVLGFLLLIDARAGAFYAGERLLLSYSIPRVVQQLEAILSIWGHGSSACTTTSNGLQNRAAQENDQDNNQVQVQRKDVDRLKNEFISMVSHEIRNPLTAIKGYAVLLQAYGIPEHADERDIAVMSPQRQREYLNNIMEQTQHLEVLINDLLDVSRIHAGRLQLHYRQVDVVKICQQVVQLIQRKYEQSSARHAEIVCTFAPNLSPICTDSDRLQQVLTNLLDNAMKYSPDGGSIEVKIALHSDTIVVSIRDAGIGIVQEQQQYLFQPFKRLEHPLAHDIPGAGLGLYITRKLVEAMHGEITLSSREAEGTTVTFSLPYEVRELGNGCQGNHSQTVQNLLGTC